MTLPNIKALQEAAKKDVDFTQTTEGGSFERVLPEAGQGFLRLREYVELGIHPHGSQQYRKDRPLARFVFELCHTKHLQTVGEGEDSKTFPHTMSITVPISNNESADYIKIFSLLNYSGLYTHPIEALNVPFRCEIVLSDNGEEGDKKVTYANLWKGTPKNKTWCIAPPVVDDPMEQTTKDISAMIPALHGGEETLKAFLWNHADKSQWDSLFIEGTKTVKDKETKKEKEVSKNWIQEKIREAKNYPGSPVEQVVLSGDELADLPTSPSEAVTDEDAADALATLGL